MKLLKSIQMKYKLARLPLLRIFIICIHFFALNNFQCFGTYSMIPLSSNDLDVYQPTQTYNTLQPIFKVILEKMGSYHPEKNCLGEFGSTFKIVTSLEIPKINLFYHPSLTANQLHTELTAKIKWMKLLQWALVAGIVVSIFLIIFWYKAYCKKKKNNDSIRVQNLQLESLNNANENLIYTLTHDIKEPLYGTMILLQKLKIDDPSLREASIGLQKQMNAINAIVSNLLQVKIIDNSKETFLIDKVKIAKTIGSVLESLEYYAKAHNVKVINKIGDAPNFSLPISHQRLYLVLLNIISNAIKFSHAGQSVLIYAENNKICVRDYGDGIDLDILHQINDSDLMGTTGVPSKTNTGLGLVLIKNLLKRTKVSIFIEKIDDGGTLVIIG